MLGITSYGKNDYEYCWWTMAQMQLKRVQDFATLPIQHNSAFDYFRNRTN